MDRRILEARLCYSCIVAGKSADFADQVTFKLWSFTQDGESPFEMFRRLGCRSAITAMLIETKSGKYNLLGNCFWKLANEAGLDLATCTPEQLEAFPGIGPKTSRFFILWTRPEAKYAALDVHILRWLNDHGVKCKPITPSSMETYRYLEFRFLDIADKMGMTPRELDWEIWSNSTKSRGFIQSQS